MSSVPRHRIPKAAPLCPDCESKCTTVMSQAFAEGYHRRHVCTDCRLGFYTLAAYDNTGYTMQFLPYKDRALSPWEQQQRLEWADEAVSITSEVTATFATEFIETINEVFTKQTAGTELTAQEAILLDAVNTLEKNWDTA